MPFFIVSRHRNRQFSPQVEHRSEAELPNTFCDLTVKIKDKVYTSKILKDIWTLIAYAISNTAPELYQKLFAKV